MGPRLKKFLGFVFLLPALAVYFLAAAALGEQIPDNQLLKVGYYLIAGLAWALPAKYLIAWMNADQRPPGAPKRD